MIAALDPPDFRTISGFRKRPLKALGALFRTNSKVVREGRFKLGHVALDGTKIEAKAPILRHKTSRAAKSSD